MTAEDGDSVGDAIDQSACSDDSAPEVPPDVIEEAERLTRLARHATDDEAAAYRAERAALLADQAFTARVREEDSRDVLVLYPEEWVEDGLVRMDRIEDVDRGIERPLDGPDPTDDWAAVDAHNRAVADAVAEEHGSPHGETAAAFADFASNHLARRIETATPAERTEFVEEYFPRNAWPSDEQREAVEESVDLTLSVAERVSDSP